MRKIIGLFLAFIPKGVVMKSRINEINNYNKKDDKSETLDWKISLWIV